MQDPLLPCLLLSAFFLLPSFLPACAQSLFSFRPCDPSSFLYVRTASAQESDCQESEGSSISTKGWILIARASKRMGSVLLQNKRCKYLLSLHCYEKLEAFLEFDVELNASLVEPCVCNRFEILNGSGHILVNTIKLEKSRQ